MLQNNREVLLAGAEYTDTYTDLQWARRGPHGNWAIRLLGFTLRKAFRRGAHSITFDKSSFERARDQIQPGQLVVLAPTHRSMMDFLVCSYLCFAHPELKISIPYIAADLQIGKLPFLGWLLQQAYAFYIKRGQGKADPELNTRLQQLVTEGQTLEIFIEGTRSRSRLCMQPKRGLLRALQQTGVPCVLLPIAINYDRVPEEQAMVRELQGGPRVPAQLKPLLKWSLELIKGEVQIGRVHLVCGEPVPMNGESDVHSVSREVMAALQASYTVSSYHLRAFLQQHPELPWDLEQLTAAIVQRGGTVIESPLTQVAGVTRKTEYTLRCQWQHLFYPDLLAASGQHPIAQQHVGYHCFEPGRRQAAAQPPDAALLALLQALYAPLTETYATLSDVIEQQQSLPFANARAFVARYPQCFLPVVEEALACFCDKGLLVKNSSDKRYDLGNDWQAQLAAYRAPLWQSQPAAAPLKSPRP